MSVSPRMLAASTPNSVPDMMTEPNAAVAPRHRAVGGTANPYRFYSGTTDGGPFLDIPHSIFSQRTRLYAC
jgi:hypothetical protein